MNIIIDFNNVKQFVNLYLAKCLNCPQFINPWDYLKLYPNLADTAFKNLTALIETLVEYDLQPMNSKGVLSMLADEALKIAKFKREN